MVQLPDNAAYRTTCQTDFFSILGKNSTLTKKSTAGKCLASEWRSLITKELLQSSHVLNTKQAQYLYLVRNLNRAQ